MIGEINDKELNDEYTKKQEKNWESIKLHVLSHTEFNIKKNEKVSIGFAKIGKRKAIWPLLLEKAFAKIYGNYDRIISG